jgi:hypothetical protein
MCLALQPWLVKTLGYLGLKNVPISGTFTRTYHCVIHQEAGKEVIDFLDFQHKINRLMLRRKFQVDPC